jgi:nucleotide-binding universal stress UspA family protein
MIRRLLISTSFADNLYRFAYCLPSFADAGFQAITFLHCIPLRVDHGIPHKDEAKATAARDRLNAAILRYSPISPITLKVDIRIETGSPSDRVVAVAQEVQADLVTVGTAHRTLLDEKLFGSTTAKLAQALHCPLLILRPQLIAAYTLEELSLRARHLLSSLLISFDGSTSSQGLIRYLEGLNAPQSLLDNCFLCWISEKVSGRGATLQQSHTRNQTLLDNAKEVLTARGMTVHTIQREGNPLMELEAIAAEEDISAIAIASEHFGKLSEWSVPSLAGELLRRSWHPIFYLPSKAAIS